MTSSLPLSGPTAISHWPDDMRILESLKLEIDEEVYRLYGISDVDRRVIEDELSEPMEIAEGETEEDTEEDWEDSDVDD